MTPSSTPRHHENGSAMVLVLVILTALATTSAVVIHMQQLETRSSALTKLSRESLFCAEAGLAAARTFVATQQSSWNSMLSGDPDQFPDGYPITGDLDDPPNGVPDYEVTIRDNADEVGQDDDPTEDKDLHVFMVSRCTKYDGVPSELMELVGYENLGSSYRDMAGFSQTGSGNRN